MNVTLERIFVCWEHRRSSDYRNQQRVGQALMNAIYEIDSQAYDEMLETNGDYDCYYNDDHVVFTLNFLQERYGDKQ